MTALIVHTVFALACVVAALATALSAHDSWEDRDTGGAVLFAVLAAILAAAAVYHAWEVFL